MTTVSCSFVVETYKSHSSDIVDVLTVLLNKAQFEIDDTQPRQVQCCKQLRDAHAVS